MTFGHPTNLNLHHFLLSFPLLLAQPPMLAGSVSLIKLGKMGMYCEWCLAQLHKVYFLRFTSMGVVRDWDRHKDAKNGSQKPLVQTKEPFSTFSRIKLAVSVTLSYRLTSVVAPPTGSHHLKFTNRLKFMLTS